MLGERLGESAGKITNIRVLPTEGQQIKLEASFQGQGTLLGQAITDFGTYWQTMRPDGTLYGEGHVVMFSQSGDAADWVGGGVGRAIGAGFKASYGVYGAFHSAHGALARLATVATAIEYEVEEDGSYRWQLWEWTGARVEALAGSGVASR
jgi:hypothetical protein